MYICTLYVLYKSYIYIYIYHDTISAKLQRFDALMHSIKPRKREPQPHASTDKSMCRQSMRRSIPRGRRVRLTGD